MIVGLATKNSIVGGPGQAGGGVGGMAVGGTAVGMAVGGTAVGGIAVGGTAVAGTAVGGTVACAIVVGDALAIVSEAKFMTAVSFRTLSTRSGPPVKKEVAELNCKMYCSESEPGGHAARVI